MQSPKNGTTEKRVAAKRRKRKQRFHSGGGVSAAFYQWWSSATDRPPRRTLEPQQFFQHQSHCSSHSSRHLHNRWCRFWCCLSEDSDSEKRAWMCLCASALILLLFFAFAFSQLQYFSPITMLSHGLSTSDHQEVAAVDLLKSYNSSKAMSIVEALCSEWRVGRYAGDFCATLCAGVGHDDEEDDRKGSGGMTMPSSLRRNWTLSDYIRGGNKHVLKLRIDGRDSVLKMQFPYADEYDQQIDFEHVDEKQFTDTLLELVNRQLRLDWPSRHKDYLLRKIWPPITGLNGRSKIGGKQSWRRSLDPAEKRSVWALLQQDEFINSAMLQMSRVTPKLLGVCGHAYRVEYLVPFRMKPYYLNLKAKILVHLMGTLKLFYEFLNEPLQWCDVKFDNLGLSADYPKRFVVMDSDMLYTKSRLNTMFQSQRCDNDTDCGLFDCASQCNMTSGQCTSRTNENIDVFCKKLITQQLFGSFWSKSNRYLAACHENATPIERLKSLQLTWAWSLSDV